MQHESNLRLEHFLLGLLTVILCCTGFAYFSGHSRKVLVASADPGTKVEPMIKAAEVALPPAPAPKPDAAPKPTTPPPAPVERREEPSPPSEATNRKYAAEGESQSSASPPKAEVKAAAPPAIVTASSPIVLSQSAAEKPQPSPALSATDLHVQGVKHDGLLAPEIVVPDLDTEQIDKLMAAGDARIVVADEERQRSYEIKGSCSDPKEAVWAKQGDATWNNYETKRLLEIVSDDRFRLLEVVRRKSPNSGGLRTKVWLVLSHALDDRIFFRQQEAAFKKGLQLKDVVQTIGAFVPGDNKHSLDFEVRQLVPRTKTASGNP